MFVFPVLVVAASDMEKISLSSPEKEIDLKVGTYCM